MNRLPNEWPQLPPRAVEELLKVSAYHVVATKELPYRHRYIISDGTNTYQADMIYDKQGTITSIQCTSEELKSLLSAPPKEEYPPLMYTPSNTTAQQLYETMVEACEQSGTTIVEVKEYLDHYHILYLLLGDDSITIDFFFNSRGFISYAAPAATKGTLDSKLNKLLAYLDDSVKQ